MRKWIYVALVTLCFFCISGAVLAASAVTPERYPLGRQSPRRPFLSGYTRPSRQRISRPARPDRQLFSR